MSWLACSAWCRSPLPHKAPVCTEILRLTAPHIQKESTQKAGRLSVDLGGTSVNLSKNNQLGSVGTVDKPTKTVWASGSDLRGCRYTGFIYVSADVRTSVCITLRLKGASHSRKSLGLSACSGLLPLSKAVHIRWIGLSPDAGLASVYVSIKRPSKISVMTAKVDFPTLKYDRASLSSVLAQALAKPRWVQLSYMTFNECEPTETKPMRWEFFLSLKLSFNRVQILKQVIKDYSECMLTLHIEYTFKL